MPSNFKGGGGRMGGGVQKAKVERTTTVGPHYLFNYLSPFAWSALN